MTASTVFPDVSFVIAAYNSEDTLKRAIDSALAQEAVTVEVIVVDDCSTDGTADLVRRYSDPRVRLILQARNGGPGAARNAGIAAASGRWIATLDSDDAVMPHRLACMIARAEAAGAQIVVDNLDVVSMDGSRTTMFSSDDLERRGVVTLPDFIRSNVIFESTFNFGYMKPIFERGFLVEHGLGFDEALRIGEDYILFASALASGALCVIEPEVGYIYHIRQGSISRVLEHRHVEAMLAADKVFLSRFKLDAEAMAAQYQRTSSLVEASSFLTLVNEIKKRSIGGFLKTALENPRALRHLRMPIAIRMRRLIGAAGAH